MSEKKNNSMGFMQFVLWWGICKLWWNICERLVDRGIFDGLVEWITSLVG